MAVAFGDHVGNQPATAQEKNMTFADPQKQALWETLRALDDSWSKGNPYDLDQMDLV